MIVHHLHLSSPRWLPGAILAGFLLLLSCTAESAAASKSAIPRISQVVLAKAGRMINEKDYAGAVSLLRDFQSRSKTELKVADTTYHHPEVYHLLGICYLLDSDYQQAAQALERALQLDPLHISALLNLAKASYELGRYCRAAECFEKAYETETAKDKNPEHLYFAAVARLLAKQSKKSIALFERLLAAHPESFRLEWRENLVHALLEAGEGKQALPHIRKLAEEYTGAKQIQWREILLHQYLQLEMHDQALALADRLCVQAPTEPRWWRALVHIHLCRNRYQPALTALLVAGYLEPLTVREQRLAADLYLQLGVPRLAAQIYENMLENDTGNRQLLPNMIVSLQQLGQLEEALAVFERFAPQSLPPELSMAKADLLYSLGRYMEAAHLYFLVAEENGKERKRALQMAEYAKILADS